jgi:DNA-binding NarL/FixJ family response regulator
MSGASGIRINAPARRVLDAVVDAELCLHRLLARPAGDGAFSRRVDVELIGDETGVLAATSTPAGDGLVTVLGLVRATPHVAPGALAALTPREAEVAVLVADGLADRAIAERLHLSHHTVGQHVKRIYRRLDVDSRVALTRLLLGAA